MVLVTQFRLTAWRLADGNSGTVIQWLNAFIVRRELKLPIKIFENKLIAEKINSTYRHVQRVDATNGGRWWFFWFSSACQFVRVSAKLRHCMLMHFVWLHLALFVEIRFALTFRQTGQRIWPAFSVLHYNRRPMKPTQHWNTFRQSRIRCTRKNPIGMWWLRKLSPLLNCK